MSRIMNIREIAKQAGVSVATVSRVLNHPKNIAPKTREKVRSYITTLIDRMIIGVILVSTLLEDDDIKELKDKKTALVLIGENRITPKEPTIRIDCKDAAYKAVNHLLYCGYKDIAMV